MLNLVGFASYFAIATAPVVGLALHGFGALPSIIFGILFASQYEKHATRLTVVFKSIRSPWWVGTVYYPRIGNAKFENF